MIGLQAAQGLPHSLAVGRYVIKQGDGIEAIVVVSPVVGQFLAVFAGAGIDPEVEQPMLVAADLQDAVVQVMQGLAVGLALFRRRRGTGDIEFGKAVDDLAGVVAQVEHLQITGRMLVAKQVVIAKADRPIQVLPLAGEPVKP